MGKLKKVLIFFIVLLLFAACKHSVDKGNGDIFISANTTQNKVIETIVSITPNVTATTTITTKIYDFKFPDNAIYKIGDTNSYILELHKILNKLGLVVSESEVYSTETKRAIIRFQREYGLEQDGIAGPNTLTKIEEIYKISEKSEIVWDDLPLEGFIIGIDPGHQLHSNSGLEKVSPYGEETKKKVSSGTQGVYTRVPEYEINLQVGLKLKEELETLGATVIITRETHDVDISNAERAIIMNDANADAVIRIHADGSSNPEVYGMHMLVPSLGCMHNETVEKESEILANALKTTFIEYTGAKLRDNSYRSDITGFCWSTVPVCLIEMGYMSNEAEDRMLVSDEYQNKIVDGLVQGFIKYFDNKN